MYVCVFARSFARAAFGLAIAALRPSCLFFHTTTATHARHRVDYKYDDPVQGTLNQLTDPSTHAPAAVAVAESRETPPSPLSLVSPVRRLSACLPASQPPYSSAHHVACPNRQRVAESLNCLTVCCNCARSLDNTRASATKSPSRHRVVSSIRTEQTKVGAIMPSGSVTLNESPKKFVFNKVKYQFLAAICGE